jgi:peptidoglycan/LPS O-acetylase OafA/YrhL
MEGSVSHPETEVAKPAKHWLPSGKKLRSLNGIRAFAILLVFFHHMTWSIPERNAALSWIKYFCYQGWIGVDLFFVLSGFLITGILVDTRTAENYFKVFYARRVLRIFPLYYATLIGILVAAHFIHPYPTQLPLPADRYLYYLFLTNWLCLWKGTWGANVLGHFWSLAVEEQFYLLWPLSVWLIAPKNLKAVAAWLSVSALVIRVIWAMHGGLGQGMSMMTFGRMDSLLVGAICAIVFRDAVSLDKIKAWLPWIAVSMIGGFYAGMALLYGRSELTGAAFAQTAGYSMLALGCGALVLHSAGTEGAPTLLQKVLRNRSLSKMGAYSYGFYIFHVPVIGAAKLLIVPRVSSAIQATLWFPLVLMAVLGLVTFGLSAASFAWFEEPILNYKRYFEARFADSPGERS